MNKDNFHETLKRHFMDEIHEAYLECEHEHGTKVDYPKLKHKIRALFDSAQLEGIEWRAFSCWIMDVIPEHFEELNKYFTNSKKAA